MQPYAESFYKSKQWQKVRRLCLQRAGGLCEKCLAEGMIKSAVVAHHKTPITKQNINDPSITLNLDNLQALCWDCHAAVHSAAPRKRYTIDKDGRICGLR